MVSDLIFQYEILVQWKSLWLKALATISYQSIYSLLLEALKT